MNNAIILAAGKGSRMKTSIPKCAITILGKPMIEYVIEAVKTSVEKTICVVGAKKEVFLELLSNRVVFAMQEEQLGTAHAVKCALPYITDENGFSLILSGDVPFVDSNLIQEIIDYHLKEDADITVVTTNVSNPFGYGRIVRDKKNHIVGIVEEKEATDQQKKINEINAGIYCVKNTVLKQLINQMPIHLSTNEYYLTDLIEACSGVVLGYPVSDSFKVQGMNDLIQLSNLETEFRKRIILNHLKKGVRMIHADSILIGSDVEIESGVTIYPGSILLGKTKIQSGAIIGPNTEINNSIIEENVVCRHSVVSDSCIQKDSTIGPFAHIRMNSVIGPANRIGNFVELKNTILGEHCKASHLSYIGDTEGGKNINFGCGSITVNYDGKVKHKTEIGDGVFIGCNSNLIAPIHLASHCYIAAGSTITDDLEEKDFAIARVKQLTKKKYAGKYHQKLD
ncbi:MAG: bifunctional UDP-N-acetylglucosamine diphosphorylase/glucosamine-1-phosphate N-acetyltransferase GlmU [Anaeroplasmataceae bacterium]|nr:bifunctional UDP-N-acetylglucosamine diphosphorylase/glucosamine-1-phosphate N-acetyltransferase GlmU [Anaeroplasmataceae bacterium]